MLVQSAIVVGRSMHLSDGATRGRGGPILLSPVASYLTGATTDIFGWEM
jgi:hypothetical protein